MGSNAKNFTVEQLVKLGILEKPIDGNHGGIHPKSSDFVSDGIPFIMASDLKNGMVDVKNCKFISLEQAKGLRKGFARKNDVLLSHKATLGRTAVIGDIKTDFLVLTPQITYYRVKDTNKLNPYYLKYYFDSKEFQNLFEQWGGGGSTRLYLGITEQLKLPIEIPSIETQNYIVDVIDTLDQKISLNRQINQTLEQMTQTLFKSWFVDFDPVIDNALDAGNEIPEPLQARAELRQKVRARQDFQPLPADVRALFPAEFEESELGWVPKGWEVQALFDLAEFINGAAYKAFNPNTIKMGKPIIKIAELKSGITESTAYSDIDMPSKYLLQDSDILFSWSGNPDTSIDTFVWSLGEAWLNQHIFKVVPKNIKHRSYVLMTLKYLKPTFTAIARDKQTTGLGHVTVKDLKELLLPIPASVTIETTGNLFNSYLDQIFGLTKQIQNLISLRDALLPKLISGELALDDLPADVAEAAEAV